MGLRVRPLVRRRRLVEAVHPPAVVGGHRARVAVRDVPGGPAGRAARQGAPHAVVQAVRHAVRPRERAEQVVEGPVLLDQEHHVLDGPAGGERRRGRPGRMERSSTPGEGEARGIGVGVGSLPRAGSEHAPATRADAAVAASTRRRAEREGGGAMTGGVYPRRAAVRERRETRRRPDRTGDPLHFAR